MLRPGASVTLRVPASSANLGPGYDCVGLALGLWDEASATICAEPGLVVDVEGEGGEQVPRDEGHLVVRAMHAMWEHLEAPPPAGLHLQARNGVPHGRGLGSSAAAIVMGASLAHALAARSGLVADELDLDAVNQVASGMEGHPDNASASAYGGATLSVTEAAAAGARWPATTTVPLALHPDLVPMVLVPETTLSTTTARAVLPPTVSLATAAAQTARGGLLVHALTADPGQLLAATVDQLHQEPRRASYPTSMALVDSLRQAGHAATISGAGPSVLVLTTDDDLALTPFVPAGWRVLTPGVARCGVTVVR